MTNRAFIARLDGRDVGEGISTLLAYRLDDGFEIVVTEERGADAVIVLSSDQVRELGRALLEESAQ